GSRGDLSSRALGSGRVGVLWRLVRPAPVPLPGREPARSAGADEAGPRSTARRVRGDRGRRLNVREPAWALESRRSIAAHPCERQQDHTDHQQPSPRGAVARPMVTAPAGPLLDGRRLVAFPGLVLVLEAFTKVAGAVIGFLRSLCGAGLFLLLFLLLAARK